MEKVNFLKNGVLRLPPGFRFRPTDEELVVQYLKRKVFSFPLPASIIPEVEVYKSDPWDLPGWFIGIPVTIECLHHTFCHPSEALSFFRALDKNNNQYK